MNGIVWTDERTATLRQLWANGISAGQIAAWMGKISRRIQAALPPELPSAGISVEQRKSLFELKNHHCRYPFGTPGELDFFFCGSPQADFINNIPYCPAHAKIAHVPTRRPT